MNEKADVVDDSVKEVKIIDEVEDFMVICFLFEWFTIDLCLRLTAFDFMRLL